MVGRAQKNGKSHWAFFLSCDRLSGIGRSELPFWRSQLAQSCPCSNAQWNFGAPSARPDALLEGRFFGPSHNIPGMTDYRLAKFRILLITGRNGAALWLVEKPVFCVYAQFDPGSFRYTGLTYWETRIRYLIPYPQNTFCDQMPHSKFFDIYFLNKYLIRDFWSCPAQRRLCRIRI